LPAARATERCAAIAVKNAKGELAQGGHFLTAVSLARGEGKLPSQRSIFWVTFFLKKSDKRKK
jgi:hypothetical protein